MTLAKVSFMQTDLAARYLAGFARGTYAVSPGVSYDMPWSKYRAPFAFADIDVTNPMDLAFARGYVDAITDGVPSIDSDA